MILSLVCGIIFTVVGLAVVCFLLFEILPALINILSSLFKEANDD